VVAFFRIPTSNDREWQVEVALDPYAKVKGDLITIHDVVKNFAQRLPAGVPLCAPPT